MTKFLSSRLLGSELSISPQAGTESLITPPSGSTFPEGWVLVSALATCDGDCPPVVLHVHRNGAPEARLSFILKRDADRLRFSGIAKLFREDDYLRLEVLGSRVAVSFSEATARPLLRPEAAVRLILPRVAPSLSSWNATARTARKLMGLWRHGGVAALKSKLGQEALRASQTDDYSRWIHEYDRLTPGDRLAIQARQETLSYRPLISVVMPVYNVAEQWLRRAIESVREQLYPGWELCIADDCSTAPHVRAVLEEFAAADPRIKVTFRERNGHISEATNSALAMASGEFVALLDHDDELAEHALYMVVEELNAHPDADVIYSDEDKLDERGCRCTPYFKSDWNPDLFLSHNMISHLGVYRTSLMRELGGFRKGYEGSQDYDLALRTILRSRPERIRHIPHVLYHWRCIPGSVAIDENQKDYAADAARRALTDHLNSKGIDAKVERAFGAYHRVIYPLPNPPPLVSVIICTRDALKLVRTAVNGVLRETKYPNLELLLVDNQSRERETLEFFNSLRSDPRVRILRYDAPFNFSAMNNFAVRESKGEVLLLLNNDTKVIHPDWLTEMVRHAMRPQVGGVGAKLYYPNDTVQHGGVVLGIGGLACHAHLDLPRTSDGYMGRASLQQNFSAVTAACMALRRQVWDEAGGLDEDNLTVAFNDVDLCLKIREKGYLIVWTPYAEMYHLESATRGTDMSPKKRERFEREIEYMKSKWHDVIAWDPCYSPNLTVAAEDFGLAFPPRAPKPWRRIPTDRQA